MKSLFEFQFYNYTQFCRIWKGLTANFLTVMKLNYPQRVLANGHYAKKQMSTAAATSGWAVFFFKKSGEGFIILKIVV